MVGLARRDDADVGIRAVDHRAVNAVDLRKRGHSGQLVLQARLDAQRRQVGPAVVQSIGRGLVTGEGLHLLQGFPGSGLRVDRVQVDRGAALHHLRQCGHAHPGTRVTRERKAIQAKAHQLRYIGGRDHRHVPRLEYLVALVRYGGRHAAVVITRHHQHTTVG